MVKRLLPVFLSACILTQLMSGQETGYGIGYQTIVMSNPAFAGSEGDGFLRLEYMNFYPGRNFNLHSLFASYDSYMPALHGGAGFFISDDYLGGIFNNLRGGFSYSYHLQIDKDLFIYAGLSGSVFHTSVNRGNIILPDQIDPLNGVVYNSSEPINFRGRTVFDIGTGFLIIAGRYTAGISLNHLARPDVTGENTDAGRLNRKLSFNLSGEFDMGSNLKLKLKPVVFADFQGERMTVAVGSVFEIPFISVSTVLLANRAKDIDLQAGFQLKKERWLVFYNYCFNLSSENRLLPLSLFHQAGVAFSLNNVDKRKVIKTINFPNL